MKKFKVMDLSNNEDITEEVFIGSDGEYYHIFVLGTELFQTKLKDCEIDYKVEEY